ncbi:serine/threonine-protein kinase haspin homolog isoform X1 [Herrania umbratica]|uniref:non-specific serine/threonine protein kinase n=2 Tax=Herrania umbratica TaxID=108875 RepID=A0A6J1A7E3_9ROSI|nr:serine/threonine-protein kinase haspin homolog isoform X1 [Herrania umbratica]
MDRKAASGEVGLWSEIIASESEEHQSRKRVQVIYQRRRPSSHSLTTPQETLLVEEVAPNNRNRLSLAAANKRVSWNRSLSTRGRTSIAVAPCVKNQPQQKQAKKKGKPPVPKGKLAEPPSFEKEKEYFQEVDAFELLEESPSPKNFGTWALGNQSVTDPVPLVSSRLEKWLFSKKLNFSCGPSSTLSKILETPAAPLDSIYSDDLDSSRLRTPEKSIQISASSVDGGCEYINAAIKKLSLATSSDLDGVDPFSALLEICQQLAPLRFFELFSKYCDPESITKVGEGTYGEAFRAGNTVCKIVPFDGDFPVNGEVQKKSEELLEEAVLSQTLNSLREFENGVFNACTTFIETIDLKVCQGSYDAALIRAWEKWDEKNDSQNDHPKEFPEKQCYVVFVLQHGGKDLESFVLKNFDEARSLLVQVTAALAVAEAAYEFEHRDMHWGNILLSRNDSVTSKFILEGKQMFIRTFGLSISIIDFTLSRINTGESILFMDLSTDPYLFKGPKGDKQSETYRKMKEVTEDYWEGSFPRTNVLWLLYLVDILLLKKTFVRSSTNERELRSLKKRLDKCNSAREAIFDPFFGDLLVDQTKPCEYPRATSHPVGYDQQIAFYLLTRNSDDMFQKLSTYMHMTWVNLQSPILHC